MLLNSLGFFTAPPKSFFSSAAIFAVSSSISPFTTRGLHLGLFQRVGGGVAGGAGGLQIGAVSSSAAVMVWWRATRSSRALSTCCNSYNWVVRLMRRLLSVPGSAFTG